MSLELHRQLDIVTADDLKQKITVIGCGGIGSPTVLALAKMGCSNIDVFDDDTVENHNIPNQIYRMNDITVPKVTALAEIVKDFTGTVIKTNKTLFDGQNLFGIVISAVDSMKTRANIWRNSVKFKMQIPIYIDARMSAQLCRILAVNPADPDDVKFYENTLYSDEEAEEGACTNRAIIYNVFVIAGLIANQVKKFSRREEYNRDIVFDLKTMMLLV